MFTVSIVTALSSSLSLSFEGVLSLLVNLSIAQIGAIVSALEEVYGSNSDEIKGIAMPLVNAVYEHFSELGQPYLFDMWIAEYQIINGD